MRIIHEKDLKGLHYAFQTVVRPLCGEGWGASTEELLDKALKAGLTIDELLNRQNWRRIEEKEYKPIKNVGEYIELIIKYRNDKTIVLELKEEPSWDNPTSDFLTLALAAYSFFASVTFIRGKWSTSTGITNLVKAIQKYSLQAILSYELIQKVQEEKPGCTFSDYIKFLLKDTNAFMVNNTMTEAQEERQTQECYVALTESGEPEDYQPEDIPFPENEEREYKSTAEFCESFLVTQKSPHDTKRECLKLALENYSYKEISGLVATIEGGENITLAEIIDNLTDGRFDVSLESAEARNIHENLNADLLPSFIDCVRMQGQEMNEELATHYDVLRDGWDLRAPSVRKLHKLKALIINHGDKDPDLMSAIDDIEKLYEKEE